MAKKRRTEHPAQPPAPVDFAREDGIRLRPRAVPDDTGAVRNAVVYGAILRAVRRARHSRSPVQMRRGFQPCMVKIRYSARFGAGPAAKWIAHAYYISRVSATGMAREVSGFTDAAEQTDVRAAIRSWSDAGDRRMFRMIVSPESPDADLRKLVRDTMKSADASTGRSLEWVAAVHTNTDHPHAHIAIRGVADGHDLRLDPDMVRYGFRRLASDHLTRQLGHRIKAELVNTENPRNRLTIFDFTA